MSELLTPRKWQDKLKLIIHGFVRRIQKLLPTHSTFYIIPSSICSIIALFCLEMEEFELISDQFELSNDHLTITKQSDTMDWKSAYGKIGINSQSNVRCYWKVKLVECQSSVFIGLSSVRMIVKSYAHGLRGGNPFYAWKNGHQLVSNLGLSCKTYFPAEFEEGDIVAIYLDLVKKQIHFGIDDFDCGMAFEDIATGADIVYYFGITAFKGNLKVAIVDFGYY